MLNFGLVCLVNICRGKSSCKTCTEGAVTVLCRADSGKIFYVKPPVTGGVRWKTCRHKGTQKVLRAARGNRHGRFGRRTESHGGEVG